MSEYWAITQQKSGNKQNKIDKYQNKLTSEKLLGATTNAIMGWAAQTTVPE
jgi:hypothetical protein